MIALDWQPSRMVCTLVFEAAGQEARVATVGVHHPNRRHATRFGATEDNKTTVRRRTGRQPRDAAAARVQPPDLYAAACLLRFEIAIEVVSVGPLRLTLPRDLRSRKSRREQDLTVVRPGGVQKAARRSRVAISVSVRRSRS